VPGIKSIGFRVLPAALQTGHVRRFGKMRTHTRRLALLDHEPPAGAALHSQIDGPVLETGQPAPERLPIGRCDPAALAHTRRRVHHVERDLLPVQIQPTYDRHLGPPRAPSGTTVSVLRDGSCSRAEGVPPDVTFRVLHAVDNLSDVKLRG